MQAHSNRRFGKHLYGLAFVALVWPQLALGATNFDSQADDAARIKIAVMDLAGVKEIPPDIVRSLGSAIARTLESTGAFKAISQEDIRRMLEFDAMKQAIDCNSVSCLAEIGGALGVEYMVSGSIALLGETYLIELQLVDISRAKNAGRVAREYKGGPKGLLDETKLGAEYLVRDVLKQNSGPFTVSVSEEGATIKLNDQIVGVSPLGTIEVPGGLHTLEVEKEGFIIFKKDVRVSADKTNSESVMLLPSAEFLKNYKRNAETTRLWAWVSLGVGGASLLGGMSYYLGGVQSDATALQKDISAYNLIESKDKTQDETNALNKRKDSIANQESVVVGTVAVGAIGLGLGSALLLAGDDPNKYETDVSVSASASWLDRTRVLLGFNSVTVQVGF